MGQTIIAMQMHSDPTLAPEIAKTKIGHQRIPLRKRIRLSGRTIVVACLCLGIGYAAKTLEPLWAGLARPAAPNAPAIEARLDSISRLRASTNRPLAFRGSTTADGTSSPNSTDSSGQSALASHLIAGIITRLDLIPHDPLLVEARNNAIRPYLSGMADTIRKLAPDLATAMSAEFTARLCGGNANEATVTSLAFLASDLPEIATNDGFNCFFGDRSTEDRLLWHMLDAWKHSGQEEPKAIAKLRTTAKDPRTLRRLMSPEEEMKWRSRPNETVSQAAAAH
jgi:hypothetical protein